MATVSLEYRLAENDVGDLPLRTALQRYRQIAKDRALLAYRHEQVLYMLAQNPKAKPPLMPAILKE